MLVASEIMVPDHDDISTMYRQGLQASWGPPPSKEVPRKYVRKHACPKGLEGHMLHISVHVPKHPVLPQVTAMSLVAGWDAASIRPPDIWRVGLGWWQLCKYAMHLLPCAPQLQVQVWCMTMQDQQVGWCPPGSRSAGGKLLGLVLHLPRALRVLLSSGTGLPPGLDWHLGSMQAGSGSSPHPALAQVTAMSLVAGWDAAGIRPPDVWRVGFRV